ncbi:MAG: hypothetical protein KME14_26630 [Tildeniella torsiva UHER 1998/13D]|jgi:hypothetical protein|nr:hypothetical protein [Tildeniella torsiva UHER 1998/13D]
MKNAAIVTSTVFNEAGENYSERYVLTLEEEGEELRLTPFDTEEPFFDSLHIPLDDLLAALLLIGAPIALINNQSEEAREGQL